MDVRLCGSVDVKADAADRRGLPAGQPVTVRRSGRTPGIGAGPRAAQGTSTTATGGAVRAGIPYVHEKGPGTEHLSYYLISKSE